MTVKPWFQHAPYLGQLSPEQPEHTWERESGLIAVYEAAPRSEWTTDAPTHPGCWWVRRPGFTGRVVEVYVGPSGALVYAWSDIQPTPVPRTGLEWSSRQILEPLEPPAPQKAAS